MGKRPKLGSLDSLFKSGKSFSLTDSQYEAKTGVRLPKDRRYLLHRSALAQLCKEQGYKLSVQEKMVFIEKE